MATKNEQKWQVNYEQLKDYILEHHQLPDNKPAENRGLLNWWQYSKKTTKTGKQDAERIA